MKPDFIIIGSGISGALTARYLTNKGKTVVVLESSDMIGGRFGTIEIDGIKINHGNIFIRDSHEKLVTLVNNFLSKPLERIRMDYVNLIDNQYHIDSRYIYLPESHLMSDICADLLKDIDVRLNSEVIAFKEEADGICSVTKNHTFMAENVIMTVPTFIAESLLKTIGVEIDVPNYNTIFTLIAEYDPKIKDFDFPYYKFINHPVLKEIFVDKKHDILVIHANDYMRESLNEIDMNLVRSTIYKNFKKYFDIEIKAKKFHVWKFAKNLERRKHENLIKLNSGNIYLVSDWVSQSPNVNGVAESFQRFTSTYKGQI